MLFIEQKLNLKHESRGVKIRARLIHGVRAKGWRMRFALILAEVELETRDPNMYRDLERRLNAVNIQVRPLRRDCNVSPKTTSNALVVAKPQPALHSPSTQMKPIYNNDNEMKVASPPCHSPGAILPDLPQAAEDPDKNYGLCKEASSVETQQWLSHNRFSQHANTFANFSGADLLRLSRDDIIQICGLADGIRLFNALHAKRIEPRLTVYICPSGSAIYYAVYLYACRAQELLHKLNCMLQADLPTKTCDTVVVSGPHGARVRLTDELVRHLPDNSTFRIQLIDDNALLLTPTN